MTTITNLTETEIVSRTASLMNLSKSALATKCALVGQDTTGSKAQLVARILSKSAAIHTDKPAFDFSGLTIRI